VEEHNHEIIPAIRIQLFGKPTFISLCLF